MSTQQSIAFKNPVFQEGEEKEVVIISIAVSSKTPNEVTAVMTHGGAEIQSEIELSGITQDAFLAKYYKATLKVPNTGIVTIVSKPRSSTAGCSNSMKA